MVAVELGGWSLPDVVNVLLDEMSISSSLGPVSVILAAVEQL